MVHVGTGAIGEFGCNDHVGKGVIGEGCEGFFAVPIWVSSTPMINRQIVPDRYMAGLLTAVAITRLNTDTLAGALQANADRFFAM
jgi:hypothetical protein